MNTLFRDTRLLFAAHLRTTLRSPAFVILGLFQPLCYLLLFAPLLEGIPALGGGSSYNVFVPGLLVLNSIYGAAFVGFGVIAALRGGVIERLRVTPVTRLALPLSLVLRDVMLLMIQCALLVGLALLLGLRPDPLGLLLTGIMLVLMGVMIASCSYGLALALRDENALASALNFVALPLMLLSGVFLPLTLAPPLIQTIAQFNPMAHIVTATRALMNGDWTNTAILIGFGAVITLAFISLRWAVRSFKSATA